MSLSLVTAPTDEPLTLLEAKLHLRVDQTAENSLIDTYISASRQAAEHFTSRALMTQTWDWKPTLKQWAPFASGRAVLLPKPPLVSVTSVKYLDTDGAEQTYAAANYLVTVARDGRGYVQMKPDAATAWPSTYDVDGEVTVRFVAGYGDQDDIPGDLKAAMLLIVGNQYANRESVIITGRGQAAAELPQSAEWLMLPYREVSF